MIGRTAGTTSVTGLAGVRTTTGRASSGSHSATGSASAIRPSWISIMTAAAVTGLVIEARRKIESLVIDVPPALTEPTAAASIRSPRASRPTAPGSDPRSTCACKVSCRSGTVPPPIVCSPTADGPGGPDSSVAQTASPLRVKRDSRLTARMRAPTVTMAPMITEVGRLFAGRPASVRRVNRPAHARASRHRNVRLQDDACGLPGGYRWYVRTTSDYPAARPPLSMRLRPGHWAALDYAFGVIIALLLYAAIRPGMRSVIVSPAGIIITSQTPVTIPLGLFLVLVAGLATALRRRRPVLMLGVLLADSAALTALAAAGPRPGVRPARRLRAVPGRGDLPAAAGRGLGAGRGVRHAGPRRGTHGGQRPEPVRPARPDADHAVHDHRLDGRLHMRQRRRYAVRLQDEAASRAVAQERLRIARELHDVVAHSMSVIAVQAGYGQYVIDAQPGDARAALGAIQATSREALDEMRRMLGALRQADDADARQERAGTRRRAVDAGQDNTQERADDTDTGRMTPGWPSRCGRRSDWRIWTGYLADGGAGVRVDVTRYGQPRDLPPSIDLSAYRIVQEALTNVVKHARTSSCRVLLGYRDDELTIEVSDDGAGAAIPEAPARVTQHAAAAASGGGLLLEAGLDVLIPAARRPAWWRALRLARRAARRRAWHYRHARAGHLAGRGVQRRAAAGIRLPGERVHPAAAQQRMTGAATLRVVVADDQALVRVGFCGIIAATPGFAVVGEAANGAEAIEAARAAKPDVILMDVRMPVMNGIEATSQITASTDVRVLILTTFDLDDYVFAALRRRQRLPAQGHPPGRPDHRHPGRRGRRSAAGPERHQASHRRVRPPARGRAARRGASPGSSAPRSAGHGEVTARADARAYGYDQLLRVLTDREREVLAMVSRGLSNAEIAERLTISPATAKTHVAHLLTKLDARDRIQLVILAYQCGLCVPERRPPGPPARPLRASS